MRKQTRNAPTLLSRQTLRQKRFAELWFDGGLLNGENVVYDPRRRSLTHSYRNQPIEPGKFFRSGFKDRADAKVASIRGNIFTLGDACAKVGRYIGDATTAHEKLGVEVFHSINSPDVHHKKTTISPQTHHEFWLTFKP
jgi:hypothetical protein